MKLTTGTPQEICEADFAVESMGMNVDLYCILVKECAEVIVDTEMKRIRAYTSTWDYEIPYTIKTNEELLHAVREILTATYDGMEDFAPAEYIEYIRKD